MGRQDPDAAVRSRDAAVVEIITAAREDKKKGRFVQTLGSRKLWIWLRGQGHDVARCTVERIMREQGWEGARYGSKHKTTVADDSHVRYPDLVDRRFYAAAPNRLWVADFTYVATWMGFVYVAFVDRRLQSPDRGLAGSQVDDHRTRSWTHSSMRSSPEPKKASPDFTGLISYSDAGGQYTSVALTQRLSPKESTPRSGPSAMPSTTPWPRPRSGRSRTN